MQVVIQVIHNLLHITTYPVSLYPLHTLYTPSPSYPTPTYPTPTYPTPLGLLTPLCRDTAIKPMILEAGLPQRLLHTLSIALDAMLQVCVCVCVRVYLLCM